MVSACRRQLGLAGARLALHQQGPAGSVGEAQGVDLGLGPLVPSFSAGVGGEQAPDLAGAKLGEAGKDKLRGRGLGHEPAFRQTV